MSVSVISALARRDFDPWREAARLADLPRDLAATAICRLISELPEGRWSRSDIGTMAVRLVDLLPRRGPEADAGLTRLNSRKTVRFWPVILLACLVLSALMFFSMGENRQTPADDERGASSTFGTVSSPLVER